MAEERSLVKNVREELLQARDRAGEVLHNFWPYRSRRQQEEQEKGNRAQVPFPVDIYENDDAFFLLGELPGVKKEDLNIQITDTELTVTGRFQVDLDQDETVIHGEIPGADFQRSLTISDAVDTNNIHAELKDGMLKIQLAKSDKVKPRRIEISG